MSRHPELLPSDWELRAELGHFWSVPRPELADVDHQSPADRPIACTYRSWATRLRERLVAEAERLEAERLEAQRLRAELRHPRARAARRRVYDRAHERRQPHPYDNLPIRALALATSAQNPMRDAWTHRSAHPEFVTGCAMCIGRRAGQAMAVAVAVAVNDAADGAEVVRG